MREKVCEIDKDFGISNFVQEKEQYGVSDVFHPGDEMKKQSPAFDSLLCIERYGRNVPRLNSEVKIKTGTQLEMQMKGRPEHPNQAPSC